MVDSKRDRFELTGIFSIETGKGLSSALYWAMGITNGFCLEQPRNRNQTMSNLKNLIRRVILLIFVAIVVICPIIVVKVPLNF